LLQFIQLVLEIATVVCIIQNRVQLNVVSVKLTYTITIKNVNDAIYIKQDKNSSGDLCKILRECQRVANVPNGEEILPKIITA